MQPFSTGRQYKSGNQGCLSIFNKPTLAISIRYDHDDGFSDHCHLPGHVTSSSPDADCHDSSHADDNLDRGYHGDGGATCYDARHSEVSGIRDALGGAGGFPGS